MRRETLPDNGGRRSGGDRRAFSYAIHIPEMRSAQDRRSFFDRRYDKKVKLKKENFDMTDAYCCVLGWMRKEKRWK